jgi:hypothetical protein
MRTRIRWIVPIALVLALVVPSLAGSEAPGPDGQRLRAHVETLASARFAGRRGDGGQLAAEYVADAFKEYGLEPLFEGDFYQEIPGREPGEVLGRNVGARIVGADPAVRDDWIIVGAHFDHLGVRDGVLYPGADDNASGVAMMLEIARTMARAAEKPRRGVMFVGFDLEEEGLWGSRHFARNPPVPLEKVALFLTADMIGRSLGGVCEPYVFAMGSEHAPGLRPWLRGAAEGKPLTLGIVGSDLLVFDRSDYGPFRARKVPYLFFSTGENPTYHRPSDKAETINFAKLEAISRLIASVVNRAAMADNLPKWSAAPDHPIDEARAVRDVFRTLLAHRDELKIKGLPLSLMTKNLPTLDAIIDRGTITPAERSKLLRVAQYVLYSVL